MNKTIYGFPLRNATLLATKFEGDNLYWLAEGIPSGIHKETCSCKFCKDMEDTNTTRKDRNVTCFKCHAKGHTKNKCPNKPYQPTRNRKHHTKKDNWENTKERVSTNWNSIPIRKDPGWGTDNPNWETQELDPNWTKPSDTLRYVPELSDYSKHVQECFKKRGCEHMRMYSYEEECITCRMQFDTNGKRIQQDQAGPSSPKRRNSDPKETPDHYNKISEQLINDLVKKDAFIDKVFPDLPYSNRTNTEEAIL
jgi:hypothetical protein